MGEGFSKGKSIRILIALHAAALVLCFFSWQFSVIISAAIILSAASVSLVIITRRLSHSIAAICVFMVLLSGVSVLGGAEPADIAAFLLMSLSVGVAIGRGIKLDVKFSEYMLQGIVTLALVTLGFLIYDLARLGIVVTVDNLIDASIAPSISAVELYAGFLSESAAALIDIEALWETLRITAIGTFCAAAILQAFAVYALIAFVNLKLRAVNYPMLEKLTNFRISRLGSLLFIGASIVGLSPIQNTANIVAQNFYIIMQFPLALCGICAIFWMMGAYKAKRRTKRMVVSALSVLCIAPFLSISSGLAFVGALNCLFDMKMRDLKEQ